MPRRQTRSRRLATAARWPVGIALTSWQYMWRTTPMHRVEVAGTAADDAPPPLPTGVAHEDVQLPEHGVGPLFHRRLRRERAARGAQHAPRAALLAAALPGRGTGEAYDEHRDVGGRPARVSGWNYRTLEGHLEIGQMAWEVWKWEDTGAVEFHIHAFSRAAPTDSVLVRVGLRLFARREQLRFYRHACARMRSLTIARLSPQAEVTPASG